MALLANLGLLSKVWVPCHCDPHQNVRAFSETASASALALLRDRVRESLLSLHLRHQQPKDVDSCMNVSSSPLAAAVNVFRT